MPQQQSSPLTFFDNANSQPDFTVALRGYDREQVNSHLGRLTAALTDAERWRFWVAAAIEDDSSARHRRAAVYAQPFPNDVEGFNAAMDNAMEAFKRECAAEGVAGG